MNNRDKILLEKISSALEKVDTNEVQESAPIAINQRKKVVIKQDIAAPNNSPQKLVHSVLFQQAHKAQDKLEKTANQSESGHQLKS